jgi:hypothetical protein
MQSTQAGSTVRLAAAARRPSLISIKEIESCVHLETAPGVHAARARKLNASPSRPLNKEGHRRQNVSGLARRRPNKTIQGIRNSSGGLAMLAAMR